MANNPQYTVDVTPSLATTTNGSSTVTVLSVPFHDTTGGQMITFDVVGYDFTNNEVATAKVAAKVKNVSGTLSMVGTPVHLVPIQVGSSTGLRNAAVTVVVAGSNVNLNVIGVADRTIKWVAYRSPAIEVLNSWTAVTAPEDGYVASWEASNTRWNPVSRASFISGLTVGGNLSGTLPNPTVVKINDATVPVAGALTTGNVLQVSGASALSYGPVNLAGGANYVTGSLPLGGDVTGGHDANTVTKLRNRTISTTAPTDGYVYAWHAGSSEWRPSAIGDLPGGFAGGSLGGSYPNPTVVAIDGDGTGIDSNVNVACQNMTFTNGGTTVIEANSLYIASAEFDDPIGIFPGLSPAYGMIFQGSNTPNIQIGAAVSEIAWDQSSAAGPGYHDHTFYIRDMNAGTDGYNFYISGQSTVTASKNGGKLYLSTGVGGAGGVNGDLHLRTGTTDRVTITPTVITISGATVSLPDITTSGTASAGAATLPGNPVGFISVTIAGTVRKIPYYAS